MPTSAGLNTFRRKLSGALTGQRRPRIPILMYHNIADCQARRHSYYRTYTSPLAFAQQMRLLHDNDYRTVSIQESLRDLALHKTPTKSVVITFDDGYADFYRQALPVLNQHGFSATVYVIASLLKTQRTSFNGAECLTLAEVRELHSQGISIGSHTLSHPMLTRLSPCQLEEELCKSKTLLEDELGAPVKSFAYPFAFPETNRRFVCRLEHLLTRYGYADGVTTILGTVQPGANRYFLPRLPAHSGVHLFRAKLVGACDWLHAPQYFAKTVKHFLRPVRLGARVY